MPAAGRPDSKYVSRIHYCACSDHYSHKQMTRCGKRIFTQFVTNDPRLVTCKTCLLILDIPVGELDD